MLVEHKKNTHHLKLRKEKYVTLPSNAKCMKGKEIVEKRIGRKERQNHTAARRT